ncbi:MAG: DUF2510 domain-containing protein [Solirubrobacterales bacterium]
MEQGSAPAESYQAPAGWYVDPISGEDRYWDGARWTDQFNRKHESLVIGGYFAAWFFFPIGLVIGTMVLIRGRTGHGFGIIGASIVFGVFAILYLTTYFN